MNKLKLVSIDGKPLADSRDIAEMIDRQHFHLIRDIDYYVSVIKENPDLDYADYFLDSEYMAGNNRKYKKYLLTKRGCDMVANKVTGEKGIMFTAVYVKKFEEMEAELLLKDRPSYMIEDPKERAQKWIQEQEEKEQLELKYNEAAPKAAYHDVALQADNLLSVTQIAKDYGWGAQTLNKKLNELGVQYHRSGMWHLYHKYQDKGYAHSKTQPYAPTKAKPHLYWTQKGKKFIYELLKEELNIVPVIERENQQLQLVK